MVGVRFAEDNAVAEAEEGVEEMDDMEAEL